MSAGYTPSEIGGDRDGDAISLIEIQIARSESPRFTLDAVFDADHDSDLRRGSCSREFSSICSKQVFWSLEALFWASSVLRACQNARRVQQQYFILDQNLENRPVIARRHDARVR